MIDLYTWPTPNGHKIHIMLEETGLEYNVHAIDIGAGEQFQPHFLEISPNNKIPAMVDQQGPDGKPIALAESGAMLFYLASKTGKFLPKDLRKRWQVMQWVMTQMGHVGPMLGQAHHFLGYAPEKIEYAMNRYKNEANRLYGVLDKQLERSEWLACDEYTIADMATMPWLPPPERPGGESRGRDPQAPQAGRHPGEQRGHQPAKAQFPRRRQRRLGRDRARQPVGDVLLHPGGAARHEGPQGRRGDQRLLLVRPIRECARRSGLRRDQARGARADRAAQHRGVRQRRSRHLGPAGRSGDADPREAAGAAFA